MTLWMTLWNLHKTKHSYFNLQRRLGQFENILMTKELLKTNLKVVDKNVGYKFIIDKHTKRWLEKNGIKGIYFLI